jgi:signal peptide peptidase SppA
MNKFWMGTEDSYEAAMLAVAKCEDYKAKDPKAGYGEEDDPNHSPYLSVVDEVGIVTVQGSLVDGEFGIMGTWFGITGYGDIQKALVAAVRNADVKSVLMVIKSGGGAVSGVSETAKFIENVDKVKPVTVYSPSTIASAALWLGLAARETLISSTTIAGSIGTITVMASRYRQLQEDGIDTAVIRSGKYKALGNMAEPMSELAQEETQRTVDYLSDIFLSYVAERRGVNKIAADTKFGQGRTFVGEQALAVGLVDGVSSYTQAFVSSKSKVVPDNSRRVVGATIDAVSNTADNANQLEGKPMHIPTPEELAAMAAGIDLKAEAATSAKPEAGTAPAASTAQSQEAPTVETLTAQIADAQRVQAETLQALADATTEAETLKATAATLQSTLDSQAEATAGLTEIVRATIKTMSLPFNLETGALAELAGTDLVAKHKEISELFKSKVKAGGVAAATRETKEDAEKQTQTATVNPLFLAAAQLNSRTKGK